MKKKIRSNPGVEGHQVFVFSLADKNAISKIDWEDDHEFRLNGKMYDVIEQMEVNGNLIIRCISDDKETALIKKYERLNEQSGNNTKNKTTLLVKLMTNSYLAAVTIDVPASITVPLKQVIINSNIFSADLSDVLTPPPQFC